MIMFLAIIAAVQSPECRGAPVDRMIADGSALGAKRSQDEPRSLAVQLSSCRLPPDCLNYRANVIPDMKPQLKRAGIPGAASFRLVREGR